MKNKIKLTHLKVVWRELKNGCRQYECYCDQVSYPIGFVWGETATHDMGHTTFWVQHSYTIPWARRVGVRKAIQEILKSQGYDVATMSGTPDGMGFMKAMGYKKLRPWGMFIDEIKVKKKRPEKKKGSKRR